MAGLKPDAISIDLVRENNTNWGAESRRVNNNYNLLSAWMSRLTLPDDQVQSDYGMADSSNISYIKNKPYVTQTSTTIPDITTLTYLDDLGVAQDFKPGDEIRYQGLDNTFSFYKLLDVFVSEVDSSRNALWVRISDTDYVLDEIDIHNTDTDAHPDLRLQIENHAYFKGYVLNTDAVMAIVATPNDYVYNAETGTKWVYDATNGWEDSGENVPDQTVPKGTTLPLPNGVAAIGDSEEYAPIDHIHPSENTSIVTKYMTIDPSSWVSSDGLYQLTLSLAEVTVNSLVSIGFDSNYMTTDNLDIWDAAAIIPTTSYSQTTGLVVMCRNQPEGNIYLTIIIS